MAQRRTSRKLELFALHARRDGGEIDYEALFTMLLEQPARTLRSGDRLIAIPTLSFDGSRVRLAVYEGAPGVDPLIFNTENFRERVEELGFAEIIATKTHALIDIDLRRAVIEYNHRGAKATDIALVLETAGRSVPGWEGLTIDFNPVVRREFLDEIDRFERIRVAAVHLSEPNQSWAEDAEEAIADIATRSNGGSAAVEVHARRGADIARTDGIIEIIRMSVQAAHSFVSNAFVVGRRPDEAAETKVSLLKHTEHQRVEVRLDEHGHVDDEQVISQAARFLETREDE